ncbi:MAG: PTS sugar transporter subunit IIC [Thermodesulfobacteriota bacterium]|nr:PTS sugar transporter subunit IIC [Thermodesulfobacteriota bacterium]
MTTAQWLMIIVVSVLSGIDRTAMAQTMLSRPLVCASLTGLLLGIFPAAFQLGLMLELLWLMRLPVGATIAPDDTQAAIGAVVLVKLFACQLPEHQLGLIVFIGVIVVVMAEVGKCWDVWARHINERLFLNAVRGLDRSCTHSLVVNHYAGLCVFACAALISLSFIVGGGSAILWGGMRYMGSMATLFTLNGQWLVCVFVLVGVAATLKVLQVKHTVPLFVGGYSLTCILLEIL